MSNARLYLLVALLLVHILVAVWDIWMVAANHPEDTVSAAFLSWSQQTPAFAFFFGVLAGHIFWPQTTAGPK